MHLKLCLFLLTIGFRQVISLRENHVFGFEQLYLNAEREENVWTAYGTNSSGEIRVPASVPGGIYTDLEVAGLLSSKIYHEYNDMESRWVGRTNWTFARKFNVSVSLMANIEVNLICEGLDTIGSIFINDVLVGRSENMFVRYIFDIKEHLKLGENEIRVEFRSPVEVANERYVEHLRDNGYPIFPEFPLSDKFRGEPKGQMIRKMLSSFSWDWGPSYPSSGIWKDIYIEGNSGAVIRDVMIFSKPSQDIPDETENTQWNLTARVYYDAAVDESGILGFGRYPEPGRFRVVQLKKGRGNSVDISITQTGSETSLWWPNGYGFPNLYNYNVSLSSSSNAQRSERILSYGFRTIELVEDFVDPQNPLRGRDFYFRVNGIPIYAKGSNSIPQHVLPERVTRDQTDWLLFSAQWSHQNMIRVWGGGIYESDEFFDAADEYGILIWEDFMFACAMYPATAEFLEDVKLEVETQVKRLQYRTSLALWAGNNENEAFLSLNVFGTDDNFTLYKDDYVKLYIDTIKELTEELDPSRKYIPSSPTNGVKTEEEGWVAEFPLDPRYGDMHFYNYTHDNWDWKVMYPSRFASEYGYQSFPSYEAMKGVANDITKWSWNSSEMDHRQHHPGGQKEIKDFIEKHLPLPENWEEPEALEHMLYLAQITQIMGQKTQTEFYRRLVDKLSPEGIGKNMGAMYWQLNDIWEGCSWASIEISGRWKLMQYYAVKIFYSMLALPYTDINGDVVVEIVSDLHYSNPTTSLITQVFKLGSTVPIYENRTAVAFEFLKSLEAHRIERATLEAMGCGAAPDSGSEDPCLVYTILEGMSNNFHFLQYPTNKNALKNPNLRIEDVEIMSDNQVRFKLISDEIAPFVYLQVRGDERGFFNDNGFVQVQVGEKRMTYFSLLGITPEEFLERVEVMSLYDVTTS